MLEEIEDFEQLWRELRAAPGGLEGPAPAVVAVPFADPVRRLWIVQLESGHFGLLFRAAGQWLWLVGDDEEILASVPGFDFEAAVAAVRARPARRLALEVVRLLDQGGLVLARILDEAEGVLVAVEWFAREAAGEPPAVIRRTARRRLTDAEARGAELAPKIAREMLGQAGLRATRSSAGDVRFVAAGIASDQREEWLGALRVLAMGGAMAPGEAAGLMRCYGAEEAVARAARALERRVSAFSDAAAEAWPRSS